MMDHADGVIVYLNGSQSVSTNCPNVYEYTVELPMPVEAGDFIAIHQPPKNTARFLLRFVSFPVPETVHLVDDEPNSVLESAPNPTTHLLAIGYF